MRDDLISNDQDVIDMMTTMSTKTISRTGIWVDQPTKMYLRLWPIANYNQSFQAMFRYQSGPVLREHQVKVYPRKNDLPLTSAQYRLWDKLRTELALDPLGFDAQIYIGMTVLPDDLATAANQWDQSHVFFIIVDRDSREYRMVISYHFDSITYAGQWRKGKGYQDWIMNHKDISLI